MDDAGMSLQATMTAMGQAARQGAQALRVATPEQRTAACTPWPPPSAPTRPPSWPPTPSDLDKAGAGGLTAPDGRAAGMLNAERLEGVAAGVEAVAAIPDPLGVETARWTRPNGLDIARVRTPIGVIAMIFESRPNVTADAAALCVRSGNAVILRGGSECIQSNLAIHAAIAKGLKAAGISTDAVQMVRTPTATPWAPSWAGWTAPST
jgi:glutamate-5-semialdehyde dehydrogenase